MKKTLFGLMCLLLAISPLMAAQHDYVIDDGPGATVRADINSVLQSIVTNNAAATEPGTLYPNMWWYDSSTGLMKHRTNANDAWITLGLDAADTDGTLSANSDTKVATQKATKTYTDTKMSKTGNETIGGVKTFSSSPIVPTPTTDMQASTKKYVDDQNAAQSTVPSMFAAGFGGDGSDGNVTISGATDISGTIKQYNTLTINSGQTLTAQNSIIGVKGTLTITGTISADGGGEAGGSESSAGAAGTSIDTVLRPFSISGGAGAGGGTGAAGGAGGTSGGTGGVGASNTPGTAGSAASAIKQEYAYTTASAALFLQCRGAGGGNGVSGCQTTYGKGGYGGGVIIIECNELIFTGTLTADGVAGTVGSGDNGDGSGGGGGGTIIVRAKTITTNSGTAAAAAGAACAASGSGKAGGAGGAGYAVIIDVP